MMSDSLYPMIAVLGPTGSGKSRMAMALAAAFDGEVVGCDAFQIYRGMDIGTAKPSVEEQRRIPHHLLDVREPDQDFSAGEYQRAARKALADIRDRKRIPLVVGGTGFYFRALIDGLFVGPGRSEALRRRLRRVANRRGRETLHRLLARVDAESAAALMPRDMGRIIRAYEVYYLTGKTMTWWQDQPRDALSGFRCLKLALQWPRETLYHRINQRVQWMFDHGLVEETRALCDRYSSSAQAFKAIGYRQTLDWLEGGMTMEQAVEDTCRESRRYAKRQLTWFRADSDIVWLDASRNWSELVQEAGRLVESFIGSRPCGRA